MALMLSLSPDLTLGLILDFTGDITVEAGFEDVDAGEEYRFRRHKKKSWCQVLRLHPKPC